MNLEIYTSRYDLAEAEIILAAAAPDTAAEAVLRGKLVGPRSPYAQTIEVAYPLLPLAADGDRVRARVVIPEANFWAPAAPFIYEGWIELWIGGNKTHAQHVTHGIRKLAVTRDGLRLNGQALQLTGLAVRSKQNWTDLVPARSEVNLIHLDARHASPENWLQADRTGFLVLCSVRPEDEAILWEAEQLSERASCLGWVLPQSLIQERQLWHMAMSMLHGPRRKNLIGVRVEEPPLGVLPGHVTFLVCDEAQAADLADLSLPLLIATRRPPGAMIELEGIDPGRIWGLIHRGG